MKLIYDFRFTIYDLLSDLTRSLFRRCALVFGVLALVFLASFTPPTYKIGKLKYSGGGDWYGNRTALPNLIDFCNKNLATNFIADEGIVEVGSAGGIHHWTGDAYAFIRQHIPRREIRHDHDRHHAPRASEARGARAFSR